MRSVFIQLIILLISFAPAKAQPQVSVSDPFEEPTWGWDKILQLENGNTFYFHYADGEMKVSVYGKDHKLNSTREIDGRGWKASRKWKTIINALYDIKGEPVVFLTQQEDRAPSLFRLRFNPENGLIKEEKLLFTLDKYGAGAGYAVAMGNVDPKGFYIEKDATSDSYAVICYNSFAHETGERLQVHQYSGDHQELSSSFYGKVGDYKYLNYIAMLVREDAVYLATYGYNTERSGGKDSKIIVSRLRKGEKDFSHQHIEMSDDFSKTKGVMRYNPGNQKIQLLTSTLIEDKKAKPNKDGVITRYQLALMNYVDPQTLDVKSQVLKFEKLSDYIKANLNDKNVVGPPQDMFIDPDNTTSIISEELYQNSEYDTHSTSNSTAFGNVGLTQYSPDGEETYAFGFPKRHGCFGFLDIFSHSRKVKGYWQYLNNGVGFSHTGYQDENFFSFDYINTGKARYIIYNDLPSNFDKKANEEPETLSTFHIGHAVGRTIGKNSGKYYLFGAPEDRDRTVASVQSSHYLRSNNTYATLIFEKEGRKKQCRVAWLNFE